MTTPKLKLSNQRYPTAAPIADQNQEEDKEQNKLSCAYCWQFDHIT